MLKHFAHLGPYSDLPAAAIRSHKPWPLIKPGAATSKRFLAALNFNPRKPAPIGLRIEKTWHSDGLVGEALSWSVGYGPRTEAWVFKPENATGRLPGVMLLHDHGGYKFYGKEKIAIGPDGPIPAMEAYRDVYYGGLPIVNTLAKRGFVVLVHDTFAWGSRKFPLELMMAGSQNAALIAENAAKVPDDPEINRYNQVASLHEHLVEKYAHALGTCFAGIVNFEDRIAANVLASRKDVAPGGIGCLGLSGGGMRTVLMSATCPSLKAAVPIGAMTTYPGLLDAHVFTHTWMLFPAGWPLIGDWPDAAACRAPSPLMVQYCEQDPLYTLEAQQAAHRRIQATYRRAGKPKNYRGLFYPTIHQFNQPMQADAFAFLEEHLR